MKKEQKNLEQIISEIKSRNTFDYSENEGSLVSEQMEFKAHMRPVGSGKHWMDDDEMTVENIHQMLDVMGLAPVVGDVIDVANGIWYLSEGRYFYATLSFIGAIPVIGSAYSLALKGAFKALPTGLLNNIITLIVKGKGNEAAEMFIKNSNTKIAKGITRLGKEWLKNKLGFFEYVYEFLKGSELGKNRDFYKGLDDFMAKVSDETSWTSSSLGKTGPGTTSGVFKGAWAVNKIPKALLTKGGRITTKGLNRRGAKRLWLLAQDKFAWHLFSNGGFAKLSKEIQENAMKAAKESLGARGMHPDLITKAMLNREMSNIIMLNYPKIFNEVISNAKVTAKDFAKLGGVNYNREVGTWLSKKLSTRFLLKLSTRLGSISSVGDMLIDMLTTTEEEAIDDVLYDAEKARQERKSSGSSDDSVDWRDL